MQHAKNFLFFYMPLRFAAQSHAKEQKKILHATQLHAKDIHIPQTCMRRFLRGQPVSSPLTGQIPTKASIGYGIS